MGDADGDGDLDVYALISNVPAGTNPDDVQLRNSALTFTPVPVPATGVGDAVAALDGNANGRSEFLVLNGSRPAARPNASSFGSGEAALHHHHHHHHEQSTEPATYAPSRRHRSPVTVGYGVATPVSAARPTAGSARPPQVPPMPVEAAVTRPNIFFYNLDDLRDGSPAGSTCCASCPRRGHGWPTGAVHPDVRGRPVLLSVPGSHDDRKVPAQQRRPGPAGRPAVRRSPLDGLLPARRRVRHLLAGKFLTTWPKTSLPPCFDRSTIMWGGYRDFPVRVDGVAQTVTGYSTTYLGNRGRQYLTAPVRHCALPALRGTAGAALGRHQQPRRHLSRLAVPDTAYASTAVGSCSEFPRPTDPTPAYVRTMNHTRRRRRRCQSQLRAIMSADDQFAATMQLLSTAECSTTRW